MKKIVLFSILFIFVSGSAFAESAVLEGAWIWKFDYQLNNKLDGRIGQNRVIFTMEGNKLHGKYDTTTLNGETFQAKKRTLITFSQFTPPNYYAVHCGVFETSNRIVGVWYDVDGNSGDFELLKK